MLPLCCFLSGYARWLTFRIKSRNMRYTGKKEPMQKTSIWNQLLLSINAGWNDSEKVQGMKLSNGESRKPQSVWWTKADGKPLNQPNRSEKKRKMLQGKRPFTETWCWVVPKGDIYYRLELTRDLGISAQLSSCCLQWLFALGR